jgi:hypothetical protein
MKRDGFGRKIKKPRENHFPPTCQRGSFIRLGIQGRDRHTDTAQELYLSIRENIKKGLFIM